MNSINKNILTYYVKQPFLSEIKSTYMELPQKILDIFKQEVMSVVSIALTLKFCNIL